MKVALAARRVERLAELAREIEAAGGQSLPIACDVTRSDDVAAAVAAAENALGPLTYADLVPIDKKLAGAVLEPVSGGAHARVVLGKDGSVPWGRAVPERAWFQGLTPGRVEVVANRAFRPLYRGRMDGRLLSWRADRVRTR